MHVGACIALTGSAGVTTHQPGPALLAVREQVKPSQLVMHLLLTTCFVSLCRYGLTSVDLPSYVAGSWLGMLPGTIAYVCAGNYGRQMIDSDEAMGGPAGWQIAVGLAVTVAALAYIGKVATKALKEVEEEDEQRA